MQSPFILLTIALLSWSLFGAFVLAPGTFSILRYGSLGDAIAISTIFGAFIGLIVGIITAVRL